MRSQILKVIKIADVLLAVVVITLSVVIFIYGKKCEIDGERVQVFVDGQLTETYELANPMRKTYSFEKGNNTLVIEEGKAYLTECDCPDKLCEKMGSIEKQGEVITCLPHRLQIVIQGESEMDAVNF